MPGRLLWWLLAVCVRVGVARVVCLVVVAVVPVAVFAAVVVAWVVVARVFCWCRQVGVAWVVVALVVVAVVPVAVVAAVVAAFVVVALVVLGGLVVLVVGLFVSPVLWPGPPPAWRPGSRGGPASS